MKSSIVFKWLSLPIDPPIPAPRGLKDYQVGWFWNLFWASLQAKETGYLPFSDNLWSIAGALSCQRWDAGKSSVLGAFEIVELEGKQLLYYPPLKHIIEENLKQVRQKKVLRDATEDSVAETSFVRKGMSPRLRFEVMKRDGFTCQYCSRRSPEVDLEVDHIIPVVERRGYGDGQPNYRLPTM